jgi:hypothetical protein
MLINKLWIVSSFCSSSMIDLHALATKLRTKVSVPIGTPIPIKPSGQKEASDTSISRGVKAGLLLIMLCATSNPVYCITPLGRTEVLETLRSSPAFSLRTYLSSDKTCSATRILGFM